MPKNIDFQKFPPSQFSSDSSLDENSGLEGKIRTFEVRFREVDNESDPKVKIFIFPRDHPDGYDRENQAARVT